MFKITEKGRQPTDYEIPEASPDDPIYTRGFTIGETRQKNTKENRMKIYLLYRKDIVGSDEYDSKVVVADNEQRARELANEDVGDEGYDIWNNPDIVVCEEVDDTIEGVVIASFIAG